MSKIENSEKDFIVKLVSERYRSDRAFYKAFLNQRSWDRVKSGESALWNMPAHNYQKILDKLFTPYEQYLLKIARQHVQYNWAETVEEAFNKIKMDHAKFMVENGARISVDSSYFSDGTPDFITPGTSMKIEDDIGNYIVFYINVPSHQVPSGRENRKRWFDENFEKVVIQ